MTPDQPQLARPISPDSLAGRMKRYETATRTVLPRRTYTIIRVDGRAFHSYLKGAQRPFDPEFAADMDQVAAGLCQEITGTAFAYVQSDEISVLATDFQTYATEPWFGGEVQKMCSIAAATATAHLAALRPGKIATFDARVFTRADRIEVANYFIWRQQDAVRNSIAMAAQAQFSHRALHGVNTSQMQEMLWSEKGINWNDYPEGFKRGRVVVRRTAELDVTFTHKKTGTETTTTAMRSWWEPRPAESFCIVTGNFLIDTIPVM